MSADASELTYWLIPGRARTGNSPVTPDVLYTLAVGSLRIFEEDVRAVEAAQPSIRSVPHPGFLGRREDKIAAFEAAYMDLMRSATNSKQQSGASESG